MGLDKFSFTPYDNYDINYSSFWGPGFLYHGQTTLSPFWQPNQLRYKLGQNQLYARAWTDSGKSWTIDRTSPTLTTDLSVSGNNITISWSSNDKIKMTENGNLNTIVGYVFATDPDSRSLTISSASTTSGTLSHVTSPFKPDHTNGSGDKIGVFKDGYNYLFKVRDINSANSSGSITINVNDQAVGALLFYITVFDDAGNIVHNGENGEDGEIKQDLNDWISTSGGLAYSSGGASFTVKDLAAGAWNNLLPPSGYGINPGLVPPKVNFTSEMWGISSGLPATLAPRSPDGSYGLGGFVDLNIVNGYYALLSEAYERNKKNLEGTVQEVTNVTTFSYAISNYCSKEFCVFLTNSDVQINQNFACDKKALMFIRGSLSINPPLKNSQSGDIFSASNGCIFVVSGDVNILPGSNASSGSSFGYDKVNGYMFTDGQFIIKDEEDKRPGDPIIDGVYVNGGLQSSKRNSKGVVLKRYLRLEDRLKYPLLAIDLHPKYGLIGEAFFGKEYILQVVEMGIKP